MTYEDAWAKEHDEFVNAYCVGVNIGVKNVIKRRALEACYETVSAVSLFSSFLFDGWSFETGCDLHAGNPHSSVQPHPKVDGMSKIITIGR